MQINKIFILVLVMLSVSFSVKAEEPTYKPWQFGFNFTSPTFLNAVVEYGLNENLGIEAGAGGFFFDIATYAVQGKFYFDRSKRRYVGVGYENLTFSGSLSSLIDSLSNYSGTNKKSFNWYFIEVGTGTGLRPLDVSAAYHVSDSVEMKSMLSLKLALKF